MVTCGEVTYPNQTSNVDDVTEKKEDRSLPNQYGTFPLGNSVP